MFEIVGSALETEIAYRRERLSGAAGAGAWKRPGRLGAALPGRVEQLALGPRPGLTS